MGSKLSSSAASDIRSNDDNTNEVVIVNSNECTAGREFNQEINVTATNNSNEYGMMDVVSTTSTSGDETESVVSDDDEEGEWWVLYELTDYCLFLYVGKICFFPEVRVLAHN